MTSEAPCHAQGISAADDDDDDAVTSPATGCVSSVTTREDLWDWVACDAFNGG